MDGGQSAWDIANDNPFFKDWFSNTNEASADIELEQAKSLQSLRITSRKLTKNNFIVSAAQLAYVNSILGGVVKIDSSSFEEELKALFEGSIGLDITRQSSLTQIAEEIINAAFMDGDVLINLPIDGRFSGDIKTYVETIEASRIKTPPKHRSDAFVKEGVHYWKSGRLKGYHVIKAKKTQEKVNYLTAQDQDFDFIPAFKTDGNITRRVSWLFKAPLNLRPRQSRGIPVITGSMGLLRYFNQYLEAVLIGSRVAACYAGFVSSSDPTATKETMVESGTDTSVPLKGKRNIKLSPGAIVFLKKDEEITFASPNRPSDNFDAFVMRLARFVSMQLRIPYEQMFLDLSVTSYSSWRGGSLEIERNINRWRRDLEAVLRWIILTFLQEGLSNRTIKGTAKDLELKIRFPAYKTLDEEKTARARRLDLANNSTSQHRVQAGMGEDYEDLQGELTEEALTKVDRDAEVLKKQKELSERFDIIFPEQATEEGRDTSGSRRPGEEGGEDLDEEDASERRKEDGNE